MAKATPQLWAQAKALFETGKSLSEISSATGIDRALISRKAKKEGWQKGIYQQLIQDGARVASELSTLESTVKQVVVEGIDELTKTREWFSKAGLKVASMAVKSMGNDPKPIDCKIVADTLVSTMKVSGVVPYYPTSAVINNTNAQQNNEPMKIIIERDNG
jgi:predicted P-loop ATPase/GTPase